MAAFLVFAAACLVVAIGFRAGVADLGESARGLSAVERNALAAYLILNRSRLTGPAGDPAASVTIDIEPGEDARAVARRLEGMGIVDHPTLFARYLAYRGLDTGIEAGRYEVRGAMSIMELSDLLQRARSSRTTLTIPEGWRREEIAAALENLGLGFTAGDFLDATNTPPPVWSQPGEATSTLEGFLFPDTYQLDPGMTAAQAAATMVADLEARLTDAMLAGIEAQGLTPFEAITLASIVEREAIVPSERPLIASVFLNRLALGIPLQADPTVQYAIAPRGGSWWAAPLSADDLQVDSRYNTYRYEGLPPGPIANPGLGSLESIASPADTSYLFFRAACDGSGRHLFATTFEEHIANGCP